MRRLILATNNPHKVREIRAILQGIPLEIVDASQLTDPPDPVENGHTLAENAIIKATAFYRATGQWALADDSGLEVDALDGAPGVMSARFAGPGCTFADNNAKLLELLRAVPRGRRGARFRCVAALALDGGRPETFAGTVEGIITDRVHGREGFGYDPVFYSTELGRTFAEASPDDKNRVSHRGRAFRLVARRLRELLSKGETGD